MILLATALAAPPAAFEHPEVRDHFSGYLGVWGSDGPLSEGGTRSATDVFFIGSLSKQFTAVAALTLVDDGRLDLDAPVASYFDAVPDGAWTMGGEVCTVARLLRASCGLPRTVWAPGDEVGHTEDPALARAYLAGLAGAGLDFPPGSDHQYSNAGYDLAGLLVSEVAGAPLPQVLRERVLDPLSLHDTGIGASGLGSVEGRLQRGQFYMGRWWVAAPWTGLDDRFCASIGAAGGMWSTGQDLARWTRALHDGALLTPESYRAWVTPGPDDAYAMGVIRTERALDAGPSEVLWHNGALSPHGHSSYLAWLPDRGEVVVVLGHRDGGLAATDATNLGTRIRRERMGEDPKLDRLDTTLLDRALLSFQMAVLAVGLPVGALGLLGLGVVGPRGDGSMRFAGNLMLLAGLVSLFGSLRWGSWAAGYATVALSVSWLVGRARDRDVPWVGDKGWQDAASGLFSGGIGLAFLAVTPGGPSLALLGAVVGVMAGTVHWSWRRG